MKRVRNILILSLILTGVLALGGFVFAQSPDLGLNEFGSQTNLGAKPLGQTVAEIIRIALGILGALAVVLILYGGFVWMTAAGNPERIATAKKILINGAIGLAIILASLAITQFVLGALQKATGTQFTGPGSPGPAGGGGLPSGAFTVKGISPQGTLQIRNIVVRVSFNHNIDQTTVDANISIIKASDGSLVAGDFNVIGDKVEFTPSANCPAPNEGVKCFDENTEYNVEIGAGLKDSGGNNISCGALAPSCSASFTTGSLIDTQAPQVSITYPDPGQSVSENAVVEVWARATDDAGISHIEFFADGAYFDNAYPDTTTADFSGSAFWDTTIVPRGNHSLRAKAFDIDNNNSFSDTLDIVVRAEHCFNGVQDFDETGIDTGGADCPLDSGASCTDDSECASGSCINGVCTDTPIILNVSPTDGAVGTYVSILGKYFGEEAGTVTFLGAPGAGDDKQAQLAPCNSAWKDDSIVVVVPQDAQTGPISVETTVGSDATNDPRGPVISDFLVNNISRPGICQLNPNMGKSGESFNIEGNNFGSEQGSGYIHFGNIFAQPTNWNSNLISVLVPILSAGQNSVVVNQNGINSNPLNFNVLEDSFGTEPSINFIDPEQGPPGEYITIFGANFGNSEGIVEFLRADGTRAIGDTNFPSQCANSFYWKNNSVTVKIPNTFADNSSTQNTDTSVQIKRADGQISNTVDFRINSEPPRPGICGLSPDNGSEGTNILILGERFGTTGDITFYNNVSAIDSAWGSGSIKTSVPQGAVSGPLRISVNGVDSNSVNFTIQDCNTNPGVCSADEQCCDSSCIPSSKECKEIAKEGAYAWQISTGFIPKAPKVVEDCQSGENVDTPSPSPWDSRPGGNAVCVNAIVNIRFDSKLDPATVIHNGVSEDTASLYKCIETATGADPCSQLSKVNLNQSSGIYSVSNNEDGLRLYPEGGLDANSQYLVELTTGIEGAKPGGGPMIENPDCGAERSYCFRFKTKNSTDFCEIGSLLVAPRSYISSEREFINYVSSPRSKADVCVVLDGSVYSHRWNSSQPTSASVIGGKKYINGSIQNSTSDNAVAETLFETIKKVPAQISASIASENVLGIGELTVNFKDPQLLMYWPNCNTACVNSAIGGRFNTSMDESTLIPSNIEVLLCKTENCNSFDGLLPGTISYNDTDKTFSFLPNANLEISRYYLVRLNAFNIKSSSGVNLTGANQGQYFTWQFKTRADTTPCTVNQINMSPQSKVYNYIGEKSEFESIPLGVPDECSPQGQKLNPFSFNWGWLSTVPATASLINNGNYAVLPPLGKTCTAQCLNAGSKSGVSVCGNNVKEIGEDCDDGNKINGDGCSDTCQNEGSSLACGNGNIDNGEDCDDGNTISGDGCSNICLNEGSTAGKSICGNTDVGDGEDCDDGNTISGDGCSSECLNEGTEFGIASCGNSIVEAGEDCDDGNTISGDGCSQNCQNEGTATSKTTCGNSIKETGEDCDDGNTISGDGCSDVCLNEGSSLLYSSPSICGNNIKEVGEDCDLGTSDNNIDPVQYAEAQNQGDAQIQATVNNVTGNSDVQVKCVYTTDAQCQQFGPNLGVGADNCCYQKPQIIDRIPQMQANNVCRNTLIAFTFDKLMDNSSGVISIDQRKGASPCPEGSVEKDGWCNGAIKASRSAIDNVLLGQTEFVFNISSLLEENTLYRFATNQFTTKNGVFADYSEWQFTTGGNVCKFEQVGIQSPIIFDKPETRLISAKAMTSQGQEISSISGVYDWTWSFADDPAGFVSLQNANSNPVSMVASQENGEETLVARATIITDTFDLSDTDSVSGDSRVIVFLCENPWPADASGRLKPFTDPDAGLGLGAPGFNFSTYYCRDNDPLLPNLSFILAQQTGNAIRNMLFTDAQSGDALGLRIYANLKHLSPLSWYRSQNFAGNPESSKIDGYESIIDGRSTYINAANYTGQIYTNIFVFSYSQGASQPLIDIYNQLLKNLKFNINLQNIRQCQNSGGVCESDLDCTTGDICQAQKDKLVRDTKRASDFYDIGTLLEQYRFKNKTYPQLLSGSFLRNRSVSTWPSWQSVLANDLAGALPQDPLNKHSSCSISDNIDTCWDGSTGQYQCVSGSHVYHYIDITQDNYQLASDFEFNNGFGWQNSIEPNPDPNASFDNWKTSGACTGAIIGASASCGDGVVGENEECEKGQTSVEACIINGRSGFRTLTCGNSCQWDRSAECKAGQCGDGTVQPPEVCDDGQNNGRYGFCAVDCLGLAEYCGDGEINGTGEQCDLGNKNGDYGSGCSWDCKTPGPSCGDNIVQQVSSGLEQCDGNIDTTTEGCSIVDGYQTQKVRTCQNDCTWSSWSSCKAQGECGNGVKEGDEQCDDADDDNTDGCTDQCKVAFCGDGNIWQGKEICDSGARNGTAGTPSYGLTCNYCNNSCTIITLTGGYCGDGNKNGTEQCDGTDFAGATCGDFGLVGTGLACTSDCKIDTSKCSIVATSLDYCGDGKIDSGEQCDGTDLGGETCSSQKGANWSGSLSCSSNCTFDTNACVYTPPPPPPPEHFCGDGTKDSGEQCDGTDLGGATCGSVQGLYWDGSLSCKSDCTYNTNSCYYNPPIITCIPYTCSQLGYSCGTVSDGCGGTLNCGTCSNGYKCSGGSCIISCTDECSSPGQQICIGSQDIYACGEFDGDPCLDLSSYATCAPAEIYYCCSGTCCYRD